MTLKKFHFIVTTVGIGAILVWTTLVFLDQFNEQVFRISSAPWSHFVDNLDEPVGLVALGASFSSVVLSIFRIADRRS